MLFATFFQLNFEGVEKMTSFNFMQYENKLLNNKLLTLTSKLNPDSIY